MNTAQVQIPSTDNIDIESRYLFKHWVIEMANMYDMVSGKWHCDQSGRNETSPHNTYPVPRGESYAAQLSDHIETITVKHAMPPDLASVNVLRFLQSHHSSV